MEGDENLQEAWAALAQEAPANIPTRRQALPPGSRSAPPPPRPPPPRPSVHLGTTCPLTTQGRMLVACMPRIALCGGLMIGVESTLPNTPPLLQQSAGGERGWGGGVRGRGEAVGAS